MQIRINLKIFLFFLIFIVTKQIKIYALLMLFALIHEIGHLLMGVVLGFKPEAISIIPTGFTINFKTKCEDYNKKIKKGSLLNLKKIIVALAGPLTNLLIILISIIYYKVTNEIQIFKIPINLILYSNILIFMFNMLPIYPLDGGRILKGIFNITYGIKKSYIISNNISNITLMIITVLSSFLILIYKNIAIFIIVIYLWAITIKENKNYRMKINALKMKY